MEEIFKRYLVIDVDGSFDEEAEGEVEMYLWDLHEEIENKIEQIVGHPVRVRFQDS